VRDALSCQGHTGEGEGGDGKRKRTPRKQQGRHTQSKPMEICITLKQIKPSDTAAKDRHKYFTVSIINQKLCPFRVG
jgi:hypothetical protein